MKRRREKPHVSHERWLVSYADFITLLFAFFTTLYAISTVDAKKLEVMVESMHDAFAQGDLPAGLRDKRGAGGLPRTIDIPARPPSVAAGAEGTGARAVSAAELKAQLSKQLVEQVEQGLVDIEIDPRGLVVSIREAGSFPTGSADLSPVAREVLTKVGRAIVDVTNGVRIEGHTDDVPIHTAVYRSNWELSTARATTVVAFFLDQGFDPTRLSAAGYAEYHPRVENDSDTSRARNRRTDIVVLNPLTREREEPAGQ